MNIVSLTETVTSKGARGWLLGSADPVNYPEATKPYKDAIKGAGGWWTPSKNGFTFSDRQYNNAYKIWNDINTGVIQPQAVSPARGQRTPTSGVIYGMRPSQQSMYQQPPVQQYYTQPPVQQSMYQQSPVQQSMYQQSPVQQSMYQQQYPSVPVQTSSTVPTGYPANRSMPEPKPRIVVEFYPNEIVEIEADPSRSEHQTIQFSIELPHIGDTIYIDYGSNDDIQTFSYIVDKLFGTSNMVLEADIYDIDDPNIKLTIMICEGHWKIKNYNDPHKVRFK